MLRICTFQTQCRLVCSKYHQRFTQRRPLVSPFRVFSATDGAGRPSIRETKQAFSELLVKVSELQKQEKLLQFRPVWDHQDSTVPEDMRERTKLFEATVRVIQDLDSHVQSGSIQANGKHSHQVSRLMEHLLEILGSSMSRRISAFDYCMKRIQVMEDTWRIDIQQKHYESATLLAAREQRWTEAADLFRRSIDPNRSGYQPCEVSLSHPVGLYSVALASQAQDLNVVDEVMDCIRQMAMVSPADEGSYTLAAGTAIGMASSSEDFVDYFKSVDSSDKNLVATVMYACVLSERQDLAIQVYDDVCDRFQLADQWQWGGESADGSTLCDDIALQAFGRYPGFGERALTLLDRNDSHTTEISFSPKAIHGVFCSLRNDEMWEASASLFQEQLLQRLDGEDVHYHDLFDSEQPSFQMNLGPVVDVCLDAKMEGVALMNVLLWAASFDCADDHIHSHVSLLKHMVLQSSDPESTLQSTVQTLEQLGCLQCASSLSEAAVSNLPTIKLRGDGSHVNQTHSDTLDELSLVEITKQVSRLIYVCHELRRNRKPLSANEKHLISSVLSRCIDNLCAASQPEAGLLLGQWTERCLTFSTVSSLFTNERRGEGSSTTESLVAAAILAYKGSGKHDSALEVVGNILAKTEKPSLLVTTATLALLFEMQQLEQARNFFHMSHDVTPDMLGVVAQGFLSCRESGEALDVFALASDSGCVTEGVAFTALQALLKESSQVNVGEMYSVVAEVAKFLDVHPTNWLERKFWNLKRLVGKTQARKLIWGSLKGSEHKERMLALQTHQRRTQQMILPKHETLRILAGMTERDYQFLQHENKQRNYASWSDILGSVAHEAKGTLLLSDGRFLSSLIRGLGDVGMTDAAKQLELEARHQALLRR